jgi:glycosyltransferase involved in cell wall biosynthesis
MGAGLAVLLPTGFPVMQEIIDRAECGIAFQAGNEQDLIERIQYLIDHPDMVTRLKANSVVGAEQYSWEHQAHKLIAAYVGALS